MCMARSKNLHYVQHSIDVTQQPEGGDNWASGVIQADVNLSQKYGRTIRNGNNYRLVGYGATLRSKTGLDQVDVGFAGTVGIEYCPTTHTSAKAWNDMFKIWRRQKNLAGTQGQSVRYDDFEVGFTNNQLLDATRNSELYMTGLGDSFKEKVAIYGDSVVSTTVTLEDYWNSLQPIPDPSTNPFGVTIKEPKYDNTFPEKATLYTSAAFSSTVDVASSPDSLAGGLALSDLEWLPDDNHINMMTGTCYFYFKGVPPDTVVSLADELKLIITLVYEGWSPLVAARPTRKKGKISHRKSRGNRKGGRRGKR